jgi:hypothetical protein
VGVLRVLRRGLCCSTTFITQSPSDSSEEQEADEERKTNKGSDSWVAVPFASGLRLSLRELFEDKEDRETDEVTTIVSEIVSWRGSAMFGGREIECCLGLPKDSKGVVGSESEVGEDAKKNDEERRYGVTLVTGN